MKITILWWVLGWMLMTNLIGLAASSPSTQPGPQVITAADGTKFTLLGTTYGNHHLAPGFENLATGNSLYTRSNTTVVWVQVEHDSKHWPIDQIQVYDPAQTACVNADGRNIDHIRSGVEIQGFVLDAYPRWEKETLVRIQPFQQAPIPGQFVINNPAPAPYAEWPTEPLPATKSDGDLAVTLTRLTTGAPLPRYWDRDPAPANDLTRQCVRLKFDARENGRLTTNWFPWLVETTDAAGNRVESAIRSYPLLGVYAPLTMGRLDGYYYQPGLWPGELAWKVRLEFVRAANFADDEVVTFTNLPVQAGTKQDADAEWTWEPGNTNFSIIAQGAVNGYRLKLLPPLLVSDPDQAGQKRIGIILFADPRPPRHGLRLTVLTATDETGQPLTTPFSPDWAGHFSIDFPNTRDVKTLTLKLALHKSRYVEFTVKP